MAHDSDFFSNNSLICKIKNKGYGSVFDIIIISYRIIKMVQLERYTKFYLLFIFIYYFIYFPLA